MADERGSSRPRPVVVEREVPVLPPPTTRRDRGRIVRLAIILVLLALIALFVIQNDDRASVTLLAWDVEIRLAWALLIAVVLGFAIGLLRPKFRR